MSDKELQEEIKELKRKHEKQQKEEEIKQAEKEFFSRPIEIEPKPSKTGLEILKMAAPKPRVEYIEIDRRLNKLLELSYQRISPPPQISTSFEIDFFVCQRSKDAKWWLQQGQEIEDKRQVEFILDQEDIIELAKENPARIILKDKNHYNYTRTSFYSMDPKIALTRLAQLDKDMTYRLGLRGEYSLSSPFIKFSFPVINEWRKNGSVVLGSNFYYQSIQRDIINKDDVPNALEASRKVDNFVKENDNSLEELFSYWEKYDEARKERASEWREIEAKMRKGI